MKNICIAILLFLSIFQLSFADQAIFVKSYDEAIVLSETSNKRILVIFSSDNCVYCSALKDKIDSGDWNNLLEDKIVCYVDTVKYNNLASYRNVKMIPDSMIIYNDIVESRIKGYSQMEYRRWLKSNK